MQANLYLCALQAEADSIDALERYRGKCEPTFLFYGVSVCLVYVVGKSVFLTCNFI